MKEIVNEIYTVPEVLLSLEMEKPILQNDKTVEAFKELERGVHTALETYSNVHRGSGHFSMVSTHLFEQARGIVLEYLGLSKREYLVIFSTPQRAATLLKQIEPENIHILSSQDLGLSIGIRALAIKRKTLAKGIQFETGGGTTKLISKTWIIWADSPDRFEAGTPAIVNIIAFAKALYLIKQYGKNIFLNLVPEKLTVAEILYNDELEKYSGQELLDKLRQTLIGRDVHVPTMEGLVPFINLDNSASTPTFTPVWNAFRKTMNQSEPLKQEIIHEVKSICAKAMGAPLSAYDVIFTSNTTEAINIAAESLSQGFKGDTETVVINTLMEHSSNDLPWRMIPGSSLIHLSVDTKGFVDMDELETQLIAYNQNCQFPKKRIGLVAISGASNVLGTCNNLKEISRIVHQYGAQLLVDAAQLVAHRKIDMESCGIDYLAFSAHKVYAPFGCGVLIVRKGLLNFNLAEMELIQSSGEENVGGIAALGKALVLLQRIGMDLIQEEEQALTKHALLGMAQIQGLKVYGIKDPESSGFANKVGVIVFGIKSMMANKVATELALRRGIGVRYGCHCAHIIVKHLLNVPPLLEQFQRLLLNLFPKLKLPGLARVSLGIANTKEDVDKLIEVLGEIAVKPQTLKDKKYQSTNNDTPELSQKIVKQQMDDFVKEVALKVYNKTFDNK